VITASGSPANTKSNANDKIDQQVQAIVEAVKSGARSDDSARAEIVGLLCGSTILRDVAIGAQAGQMEREELQERLNALMVGKILTANGDKNFSFNLMDGKSACGWFRKFAQTARDSELRNLRSAQRRFGTPIDHTTMEGAGGMSFSELSGGKQAMDTPWASNSSLGKSNDELMHEESTAQVTDDYLRTARYLRGDRMPFLRSDALRQAFKLPQAVRAPDPSDRRFVLETLETDKKAAYSSASAVFSLKVGDLSRDQVTTDPRMLDIWKNHNEESLGSLLDRPGEVAHTIAMAANLSRPRPSSVALDRFRRIVMSLSDLPEWKEFAGDLASAYIATEFSALSSYNEHRLNDDELEEVKATHAAHAATWPTVAKAASKFVGAPLGSDIETVRKTLDNFAIGAKAIETNTLRGNDK
jgi:hypothetical protein